MASEEMVTVTVLVDDAYKEELSEFAEGLKGRGFVLKQSLESIGVLIGTVAPGEIAGLRAHRGVLAVEEERTDYQALSQ